MLLCKKLKQFPLRLKCHEYFPLQSKSTCGKLLVTPSQSLVDTPLSIKGLDLPPSTQVTLSTRLTANNEEFNFSSTCEFTTSEDGTLDTSKHQPREGSSYEGVHAMGPIWSVQPEENSSNRFWPQDIRTSLDYHLNLTNENGEFLCSAQVKKGFISPSVERIDFEEGSVRGVLFLPSPHLLPAPAIITIYGGVNRGQAPEDRAALLASHGYASLALSFFGGYDLPKLYGKIDIEYFEEAVDRLLSHPGVAGDSVGLWGSSQGGNISLCMMAFLGEKIKSAVVVGSSFGGAPISDVYFVYKDDVVKGMDHNCVSEKNVIRMTGPVEEHLADPDTQIPFERSKADLLAITGEEDPVCHGVNKQCLASRSLERARLSGKTNFRLVTYPSTGHLIGLPYTPFCSVSSNPLFPKGFLQYFGGSLQPHCLAQIEAWKKTLKFYQTTLIKK